MVQTMNLYKMNFIYHSTHNEKSSLSPTQSDHMTGNNTLKEVWIIVSISGVSMLLGVLRPWGVVERRVRRGAREKCSKIGSKTGPSSAFCAKD